MAVITEREDLAFSEGPPAAAIVTFCALLPSSAGVELHLGSPGLIIRGGATPAAGEIFGEEPGEEGRAGIQPTKGEIKWAVLGTHS